MVRWLSLDGDHRIFLFKHKINMKRLKQLVINLTFMITSISFINVSTVTEKEEIVGVLIKEPEIKNDLKKYLHDLGNRESKNNYQAVNSLGYLGRYQFGMKTLSNIGVNTTKTEFLQDAMLQDSAMLRLLKQNKITLSTVISKYDSTIVDGLLVTESGILAGAHLGGSGNVKKYLTRGINRKDAYGTSIGNYTHTFSGYELNLD